MVIDLQLCMFFKKFSDLLGGGQCYWSISNCVLEDMVIPLNGVVIDSILLCYWLVQDLVVSLCVADGSGSGAGDPWSSGGQLQSGPYTGYGSSASLLSGGPASHLSQAGFPPPTMHLSHDPMVSMSHDILAYSTVAIVIPQKILFCFFKGLSYLPEGGQLLFLHCICDTRV